MTADEIRAVCAERLAGRWTERMLQTHATPVCLIGVGHDHAQGQIVIATMEDPEVTDQMIAAFLRWAAVQLDPGQEAATPVGDWTRSTLERILDHLEGGPRHAGCRECREFLGGLGRV